MQHTKSINDFVRERIDIHRQKTLKRLPSGALAQFDAAKPIPEGMSRRTFLKSAGATLALAACFISAEMAMPNFARAANAVVYVNSGAGGANNGTSWTNAYTTLAAAITASGTTGTDFYIKSTHTEALAAGLAFKGVLATPDRAFFCDVTNSPPQTGDLTVQTGTGFTSAAGVSVSFSGNVYVYGALAAAGTSSTTVTFDIAFVTTSYVVLDSSTISIAGTGTGATIYRIGISGNGTEGTAILINTTIQFGNAAQSLTNGGGGNFRWYNTPTAIQGATLPTNLITSVSATKAAFWLFDSVDLSALSSKTIVSGAVGLIFQAIDCKLPGTVTLATTPAVPGTSYDFITTDSTAVNTSSFIQTRYQYQGTLTADNGTYNNATDGVNPISWKVITTANANPQAPFECFEIVQWAAAGTYASSTIVATSATGSLVTNDIWVDVNYMGTAAGANPLGKRATTFGAGSGTVPLPQIPQGTSPGNVATGATWATGGKGTNYTLAIPSFTTTLAGYVRFVVKVAKPTLTIYIDPAATIA